MEMYIFKNRSIVLDAFIYIILLMEGWIYDPFQISTSCDYYSVNWTNLISIDNCLNVYRKKISIHWTTLNSSYLLLTPINCSESSSYVSSFCREYSTFVHLKNVYCTSARAIATETSQIRVYPAELKLTKQLPTKTAYENIVFLYSEYALNFGHFFTDTLPVLACLPNEIIKKSKIMVSFHIDYAQNFLALFDIPREQIIYDMDYWYFAKNLYLYYPLEPRSAFNVYSFPKMINYIKNKLDLNSIKGYRYVLSNKPKGVHRHIHNIYDFLSLLQREFPKYTWEFYDFQPENLTKLARTVASFKLWCAPSGSMMHNMVFMNSNYTSGVCLISSKRIDYANYAVVSQQYIWINGISSTAGIADKRGFCVDMFYGETCIRRLLYALEYKSWPSDTFNDMRGVVNFDYLMPIMKENVKNNITVHVDRHFNFTYCFINKG